MYLLYFHKAEWGLCKREANVCPIYAFLRLCFEHTHEFAPAYVARRLPFFFLLGLVCSEAAPSTTGQTSVPSAVSLCDWTVNTVTRSVPENGLL